MTTTIFGPRVGEASNKMNSGPMMGKIQLESFFKESSPTPVENTKLLSARMFGDMSEAPAWVDIVEDWKSSFQTHL